MLFNSFEFIFAFLPITFLLVWYATRNYSLHAAITVLVVCSLFFYAWWNPAYLLIILFSMVVNYFLGRALGKYKNRLTLTLGVSGNLLALGYFKYTDFIIGNVNTLFDLDMPLANVMLPLAISFFTFQQIAYLVDSYRGETIENNFLDYTLFITFFPQLIAGPIVHHKEMLPQFSGSKQLLTKQNFAIGISIFAIGLFKKAVIADGIAAYATPAFAEVDSGNSLDLLAAWSGALAYTFQLYFDFSGYSDMAIGLARLFGIILPLNFYSPYKSTNIAEFWRRWHMTLSRFLRDYVYFSLGGNRGSKIARYRNLLATMLLGGIWHGAGWNFLIWGGLHGCYLVICHSFRDSSMFIQQYIPTGLYRFLAWLITFIAVVIGWVFFRATTFEGSMLMLEGMAGVHGISIPQGIFLRLDSTMQNMLTAANIVTNTNGAVYFIKVWSWILVLLTTVLVLPNTQDLFSKYQGSLSSLSYLKQHSFWPLFSWVQQRNWQQNSLWAAIIAVAFGFGVLTLSQVSEFLYFQF